MGKPNTVIRAETLRGLAEALRDRRRRADPFEPPSNAPGDLVFDLNNAAKRAADLSDDEFGNLIVSAERALRYCDEMIARQGDQTVQFH